MQKNAGFTLIELLVVVLIIGILAAAALPQYEVAVRKSRAANILSLLRTIKDAEERHYLAAGSYTLDFDALDIQLPASCRVENNGANCTINGRKVSYILSSANFNHPNYYMVIARESDPFLQWQWQLDRAGVLPGKRICFPRDTDEQGKKLCVSMGGTPCGAYAGWYPGASQGYCLAD